MPTIIPNYTAQAVMTGNGAGVINNMMTRISQEKGIAMQMQQRNKEAAFKRYNDLTDALSRGGESVQGIDATGKPTVYFKPYTPKSIQEMQAQQEALSPDLFHVNQLGENVLNTGSGMSHVDPRYANAYNLQQNAPQAAMAKLQSMGYTPAQIKQAASSGQLNGQPLTPQMQNLMSISTQPAYVNTVLQDPALQKQLYDDLPSLHQDYNNRNVGNRGFNLQPYSK